MGECGMPKSIARQRKSGTPKAGWRYPEYAELVSIGRSKLYAMPDQLQPKSVRVGTLRIIIEPPGEYLARLAASQTAAS